MKKTIQATGKVFLKLINNLSSLKKRNHDHEGGLDTRS